ncbi:MAG: hypothetical protein AB1371_02775 [Pseudomonadota bacterium]
MSDAPSRNDGASAWTLQGVLAGGGGTGAAVLQREGERPIAYRVGARLPDGWRLTRVERRQVWLAPPHGAGVVVLRLPETGHDRTAAPSDQP